MLAIANRGFNATFQGVLVAFIILYIPRFEKLNGNKQAAFSFLFYGCFLRPVFRRCFFNHRWGEDAQSFFGLAEVLLLINN